MSRSLFRNPGEAFFIISISFSALELQGSDLRGEDLVKALGCEMHPFDDLTALLRVGNRSLVTGTDR